MSGGALEYLYSKVRCVAEANEDEIRSDEYWVLMDIASVLHDMEWSMSGDYDRFNYVDELHNFCKRYIGFNPEQQELDD